MKSNYTKHGFGLWVLEDRATGEFVSNCGLTVRTVDGQQMIEVGYHVLPRYQRQG
ncbi:hypothetical protein GCM10027418_08070 [Mariniluteicoccus endophyticus]